MLPGYFIVSYIRFMTKPVATIDDVLSALGDLADQMSDGFMRLERIAHEHSEKLEEHSRKFEKIEQRLDGVDNRLDRVEERLDGVEHRLGSVEHRLGNLERKFEDILLKT